MRISKSQIKYIKSLQSKKHRQKYNKFIVEGVKLVTEILRDRPNWIEWVVVHESINIPFEKKLMANQQEFRMISSLTTPSGILAVVEIPSVQLEAMALSSKLNLYLDGIMDPGNMGTIIRTAEWFGIAQIICSNGCVDPFNPKVVQASMGAICRIPIIQKNLIEIPNLDKYQIMMASLEGENIQKAQIEPNGIIVIGNESQGISKSLYKLTHHKIRIPSHPSNQGESLNAGIAAGIIIYHLQLNML